MSRERRPDPKVDTNPMADGLTHNPFAALGGGSPKSEVPEAQDEVAPKPKPKAAPTSRPVASKERKGHGGRTVVRVTDLANAADYTKAIGRDLGTGARLDGSDLVVQGDQLDRVIGWLAQRGCDVIRGTK
jgi:translation initiation factor 1 (eIF-1/SUI1)